MKKSGKRMARYMKSQTRPIQRHNLPQVFTSLALARGTMIMPKHKPIMKPPHGAQTSWEWYLFVWTPPDPLLSMSIIVKTKSTQMSAHLIYGNASSAFQLTIKHGIIAANIP